MEKSKGSEGSQDTTMVVVLVKRPEGTSQVITFKRDTPLPLDFKLAGCERVSSIDHPDVPRRLEFFFDKAGMPPRKDAPKSETKAEEGLENE